MLTREEIIHLIVREDEMTRNCFFDLVDQLSLSRGKVSTVEDLNTAYKSALEMTADYRAARAH